MEGMKEEEAGEGGGRSGGRAEGVAEVFCLLAEAGERSRGTRQLISLDKDGNLDKVKKRLKAREVRLSNSSSLQMRSSERIGKWKLRQPMFKSGWWAVL